MLSNKELLHSIITESLTVQPCLALIIRAVVHNNLCTIMHVSAATKVTAALTLNNSSGSTAHLLCQHRRAAVRLLSSSKTWNRALPAQAVRTRSLRLCGFAPQGPKASKQGQQQQRSERGAAATVEAAGVAQGPAVGPVAEAARQRVAGNQGKACGRQIISSSSNGRW